MLDFIRSRALGMILCGGCRQRAEQRRAAQVGLHGRRREPRKFGGVVAVKCAKKSTRRHRHGVVVPFSASGHHRTISVGRDPRESDSRVALLAPASLSVRRLLEMGCGGSKAPADEETKADVTIVHDANAAYKAAEADKVLGPDGKERLKGEGDGMMQEGQREAMLEQLFEATDDDNSGAISMNEYTQLFDSKLADPSSEELKAKFAEIDSDPDAVLTKDEFVNWHLKKFAKLEDDMFLIIVGRLLEKAEAAVVIDDKPAIANE